MTQTPEDALKVIQSHPEGVLQSELWKILEVDSRKCSRLVKKLLDEGLVERAEFRKEGIKTFVLKASRRPVDPTLILAGGDHRVAVAPVFGSVPMVHPSAEDVL